MSTAQASMVFILFSFLLSCSEDPELTITPDIGIESPDPKDQNPPDTMTVVNSDTIDVVRPLCLSFSVEYDAPAGCDGQIYPHPDSSPYVIPIQYDGTFRMGLSNCSASFHRPGEPDQYAFDFDVPTGTVIIAARAGVVANVIENQPSEGGGGAGNYVVINHLDSTYGLYYHSPMDGIYVELRDTVQQGDHIGVVGRSGLAGYPHLHFIVVRDKFRYPYEGKPCHLTM